MDLLFSVTYHKLQGLTLDVLILSINKHPNPKLRLTLSSLYVEASRVHNHEELHVLPFGKEDADHLISLKSDPLLGLWLGNYSDVGIWQTDGLQSFTRALKDKVKMRLALIVVVSITKTLQS